MPLSTSRALCLAALASATLVVAQSPHAAALNEALDESQRLSEQAQASQARIETLDDATRKMLDEYRAALRQSEALKAYNAQMRDLIKAQAKELEGFERQLQGIEKTQEAVTPLMAKMVDVLGQFIAADLPFLPHERADRLLALQEMLPRADVSLAEKYRRILEAYQIESDYGRTLEAWRGELAQSEPARSVEFLRLGRTMLYYQTLDGHESGWWNTKTQAWEVLDDSARRPIARAIAIARQQQAPIILELPVKTLAQESAQ